MPVRLLSCVLVLSVLRVHAAPLYADELNSTFALVLCSGLQQAVSELRQRDILEHSIGAQWLEHNCVSIDPCAETSSNADALGAALPAPRGSWLSGNSSALLLPRATSGLAAAAAGVRAENHGSLEYARVPEGLRVQACAPDYDLWRREGQLACNENTLVTVSGTCPGERAHTVLDCIAPLQFDATMETLVYRPPSEKMHLGDGTWNDSCDPGLALPPLVRAMCSLLAEYTLTLPLAAAIGSTSLVRYDFLPGYGCHREQPEDAHQILSRVAAPNTVLTCAAVANGSVYASDLVTCAVECDPGFALEDGKCVSVCKGLSLTCGAGYFATAACQQHTLTFYNCSSCPPREGFGARAAVPGEDDVFVCQYTPCLPGTSSVALACEACAVNTFSNVSGAAACTPCETLLTGTYQTQPGQTACAQCMSAAPVPVGTCLPGTAVVQDFERLLQLFALYAAAHDAALEDYLHSICSLGYACLPCEPGHYEHERTCLPCAAGSYQPNFGAQHCYPCAPGQNTTSVGSTHSSDCVCTEGFE